MLKRLSNLSIKYGLIPFAHNIIRLYLALIRDLEQNPFAAHVVDGPRGPRGILKAGLIALSQTTETPIFPVYISFSRAWMLNSWDHFLIPKPFSRIHIRWGEPIYLPKPTDNDIFEDLRQQLEQEMQMNQKEDDCRWGGKALL